MQRLRRLRLGIVGRLRRVAGGHAPVTNAWVGVTQGLSGGEWRTFQAVAWRIVLTWNGARPGCLLRMRATIPVMCGAAKLFPVLLMELPFSQATSTSTPGAPNSTGGAGL